MGTTATMTRSATDLAALGGRLRRTAQVSSTVADFTITADGDLVASLGWLAAHSDVEIGRIYLLCS